MTSMYNVHRGHGVVWHLDTQRPLYERPVDERLPGRVLRLQGPDEVGAARPAVGVDSVGRGCVRGLRGRVGAGECRGGRGRGALLDGSTSETHRDGGRAACVRTG